MIKPLGPRVLVQQVDVEEQKTAGGIIIPEAQREKGAYKAEIIALGDEVTKPVAVGDLVLISQFAGDRAQDEGAEDFIILSEDDLLATITRMNEPAS